MSRIALVIIALGLSGCMDAPPSTQAAPVEEPPKYWPPPDTPMKERLECGSSIQVGDDGRRIIWYTSGHYPTRQEAFDDCVGVSNWHPYSYDCNIYDCPGAGIRTGCRPWADAQAFTELQACRCYSPVEGVWLCQRYALLDIGSAVGCTPCAAHDAGVDGATDDETDAGTDPESDARGDALTDAGSNG